MAYQYGNTFTFGEQPTATKWTQLWTNDDALYDGDVGFALSSWTPTWAGSGSMTISSVSLLFARKIVLGDLVFIAVNASFTTGGSADKSVIITNAPETSANNNTLLPAITVQTSLSETGFASVNGTTITIRKNDSSNWALGASKSAQVVGWYEKV